MQIDTKELDRQTKDILLHLDAEKVATSSELKDVLDVSSTKPVKYRCREYLIPAGLVREDAQGTDQHGRDLPLRYVLTDAGEKFVGINEAKLTDMSGEDLEQRVERLERRVNTMGQALHDLRDG